VNDDLKARILAAARATRSSTRATSRAQSWAVLIGGVALASALFFAFDGPQHGEGRAPWFYAASVGGWSAIAALSAWAAFSRGRSAVGHPRSRLIAVAVGTPVALFAMMLAFAIAHPEVTLLHPERLGLKCLRLSLAAGSVPLLALALVRRRSDPVHPAAAGAALGAACGASAGVMVEMWCPVATPAHVAIGHILPIVVLALAGLGLGRLFIGIRNPPNRRL
jgi:hypothetical protein